MKITKRLWPLLLVVLVVIGIGCTHADKTDVEDVIINELDLLKNLDSKTTQKYISYKELFPDATENTELSDQIKEVFSLFFQDFDYKILDIDVDEEKKSATASIRLSTMDAQTLARDFARAHLEKEILDAANSDSEEKSTEDISISLEERYLLLNQLLTENEYETVETNCTMELKNTGSKEEVWEIRRTNSLENDLVGGLMTYLSDPDILSCEDTLAVYLKTLKKMNEDQMSNYLGVESILNTSDTTKNAIAAALVEQVHKNFNYKVLETSEDAYEASIKAEITTFDYDAILAAYQEELDTYLASPDAVIDGSQKRYEKSLDLLLENIEGNTSTKTAQATFHLTNDGVSWKLMDDSSELGYAIFGVLTTTPVEEEADGSSSEDISEETYDSSESSSEDYDSYSSEDYDSYSSEDYDSYSSEDYDSYSSEDYDSSDYE